MITLNYRDARPIYEQVRDGLRRLIVSGAIADGEKLPSVRELAVSLAINPNTIQRAYHELESEGYIVSVPGKGSFCAQFSPQSDPRREELLARLEETVRRAVREELEKAQIAFAAPPPQDGKGIPKAALDFLATL